MTEPANDSPEDRGDEDAYWAHIDWIEQAAWKLAEDVAAGREPEIEDALTAACMMIHAAYIDRAKITETISAGYIRDGRLNTRPPKPRREAL